VAATNSDDRLAVFSSYGPASVDLAAPGTGIISTLPGEVYGDKSGTSMSTPHVSGAAALLWSLHPRMQADLVKTRLLETTDPLPDLEGLCVTGGRLNVLKAVALVDSVPPEAVFDLAASDPGSNTMRLAWTATGDDGVAGTASFYEVRYSTSPIAEEDFYDAARAGGEPDPLPSGSHEEMEVKGLDFLTTYYFAIKAYDEFGTPGPISNLAVGRTLGPPQIAVTPSALAESLRAGDVGGATLTLSNIAEGTLDFTVSDIRYALPTSAAGEHLELLKGEEDPRQGAPVPDGYGGPDGHGYAWIDSNEPGGPVFDWVDISGIGTPALIFGDDVSAGPFYIGFDFPFYGREFDSFNVSSNGFISFTSTQSPFVNQPLPNTQAPGNMIAAFWDDLMVPDGRVYVHNDGARLIIQYDTVGRYGYGGPYTFEIILYPGGTIVFQYLSMSSPRNSATIGIQDAAGLEGLQVAFNTGYVSDRLAVELAAIPDWLSASPVSGRVVSGASMDLDVAFDPSGLNEGDYEAELVIESNDPTRSSLIVPVSLNVTGAPQISVGGKAAFVSSTRRYSTRWASTHHELRSATPVGGPGLLTVEVAGDFGGPPELATVTLEGVTLGDIGAAGWDCGTIRREFSLGESELETLLADGVVNVLIENSFYVDLNCGENRHSVILSYPGPGGSLDFGGLFVGLADTQRIHVQNVGTDLLSVTSIGVDGAGFTVWPSSLGLEPGESEQVAVAFAPGLPGHYAAALVVESNDPDDPEVAVLLEGDGVEPPVMSVSPGGMSVVLMPGMTGERDLLVINDGASDLDARLFARRTAVELDAGFAPVDESVGSAAEDSVSSLEPPAGYVPKKSIDMKLRLTSAASSADVLIVQDLMPWGSTATQAVLDANDLSYELITSFELASWDITPYRFVILSSDQPTIFYLNVAAERSKLEAYLDLGGVLEVHGCGWGWNFGDPVYLVLPGGMKPVFNGSDYNFIVDRDHPLAAGIPSPFYGNSASHGYFVDVPAAADIIAVDDEGEPSLVEYQYGRGLVIASTQALEFAYDRNERAGQVLRNMVAYARSVAGVGWMSLSANSGSVSAGDSILVNVSFECGDLEQGEYDAQVIITSNDPLSPLVSVPVRLVVRKVDAAYVEIVPKTINLGAKGKYVTCYVELPAGFDPSDVIIESVHPTPGEDIRPAKYAIGDHDRNGIEDLMLKLPRMEIESVIGVGDSVPVTVVGEVKDTAWFVGTDYVRVISPGGPVAPPVTGGQAAKSFALFQNRPNPATGAAAISYELPVAADVSLKIFDASGALVRNLVDGHMPAGRHSALWNGEDYRGRGVSAGVYFYRLDAGGFTATRKLILLRR
jgi:hypothetical protein